jgi:porin
MARTGPAISTFTLLLAAFTSAQAYEVELQDGRITVGGVFATAAQCGEGGCSGAAPLQPEVGWAPADGHELYVKLGFASGDGRNGETPFNIPPWAADLQADVSDVNGSGRSHLLTAWYRYTAKLRGDSSLAASFGIIDAADYLDDNAYSNDEYTQFMNSALVNGPNVFLPSYERGGALAWTGHHWSARAVYMNVEENDDGNPYRFIGLQVGYRVDTPLGEGNYRLLLDGTDRRFLDPTGSSLERRAAVLVSCDQELGRNLGAFVRLGRQGDSAAIDYAFIYSGGVDLGGTAWGRQRDNVGLGYAYLAGGNGDLARSQVFEGYYRFAATASLALTGDLQYLRDARRSGAGLRAFILGVRLTAEF